MKKIFITIALLLLGFNFCFSSPADSVKEYKLENGMSVFLLEDSSTPLIRIEYIVKAGFSSQTQKTSGFFKLYSRVFQSSLSSLSFDSVTCNADSTRYIISIPTSKCEQTLSAISETAFNPQFTNETIKNELKILKKEVKENYDSMSGFINASIDSRVFSESPWKHDSGVYPPIFNDTTEKNAKNILSMISDRWYTPQNSAIFISGNFSSSKMTELINFYFGRFYSTYKTPIEKKSAPVITNRKFVLHNPEFSDELTQVVIQYTNLGTEESDLAAILFNNNYSYFKYTLLNQEELNIPGDEYIDASSAHKRDSSRLIVQTLLQPPENKKIKTNSLKQAELFIQQVASGIDNINTAEFLYAKQNAISNMNSFSVSSQAYMENLAAFWAMEPYNSYITNTINNPEQSITTESFLSKIPKFDDITASDISFKLKNEEPFVFVIINSNDFKKLKKDYIAAGFEEITVENASWKKQPIFANITDSTSDIDLIPRQEIDIAQDNDFYKKNLETLKEYELKNGISLITKSNKNTSEVAILISIRGGKLHTSRNHGFEEVMINILANNIQREIFSSQQKMLILGTPSLSWQCDLTTSHITIECLTEDFENICNCISNAIIYSDILPATADRAVANRQYKKRLENGSAANQLYSAAVKYLYPRSEFINIYETEKDILETTNYLKILEYYPELLDASRYTVIVAGNFPDKIESIMNNSLGLLSNHKTKINIETGSNTLSEQKNLTVQINHTFLTDIPADKAGPMPAVLIPTTEFLDPVMYIFNSPKKGTKEEALFNAIQLFIGKTLQNEINKNTRLTNASVKINESNAQMDTAGITIMNVPHTKEMDSAFKSVIQNIDKELKSNKALDITQMIKDYWIQTELKDLYTNSGTAELLQLGLEKQPYLIKPEYYLEEYNFIQNATPEDFQTILEYFPEQPYLRIYSKEGKK